MKTSVKSSYISTIIGVTLVLFLLGVLGIVLLNANKLSTYYKERVVVNVYLKDSISSAKINLLQKSLLVENVVKKVDFVSKEDAAIIFSDTYGDDFKSFKGANILPASLNVFLEGEIATEKNIQFLINEIEKKNIVTEVRYHKGLVEKINENAQKISFIIGAFGVLLLFISIALINNTVRLAIYSKRFLIRTMQLIGATSKFIRKPFILSGILQGFISGLIAFSGTLGLLNLIIKNKPELSILYDQELLITIVVALIFSGVMITWFSTYLAVRKYLRIKTDKLF